MKKNLLLLIFSALAFIISLSGEAETVAAGGSHTVLINPHGEAFTFGSGQFNHTVLADENGDVWTFGNGNYGCLGHGDTANKNTPTRINGITAALPINPKRIARAMSLVV